MPSQLLRASLWILTVPYLCGVTFSKISRRDIAHVARVDVTAAHVIASPLHGIVPFIAVRFNRLYYQCVNTDNVVGELRNRVVADMKKLIDGERKCYRLFGMLEVAYYYRRHDRFM